MGRSVRACIGTGLLVGAVSIGVPGNADAAQTIGQVFAPSDACDGNTYLQTTSPANGYSAPSAGVITAWSHQSGEFAISLKLKVARAAGGNEFTIIGDSPLKALGANSSATYTDVRIPVLTGDVIGVFVSSGSGLCASNASGFGYQARIGEAAKDQTSAFPFSESSKLDIAATIEADADGDEYGDETQDQCPSDATTAGPCPPPPPPPPPPSGADTVAPETTITGGPKGKIAKPKAKFRFESGEAASTFRCRLKGKKLDAATKQFNPCTSPRRYKHLVPGKYKFFVYATDTAGNVDLTPVTRKFKVTD